MAIELPDLVQRVRVDTSDVARAERALAASSAGFDKAAGSARRLEDAQSGAADSSKDLRTETDRNTRSSGLASRAGDRLADSVGRVRDATRDAAGAARNLKFSDLVQHVRVDTVAETRDLGNRPALPDLVQRIRLDKSAVDKGLRERPDVPDVVQRVILDTSAVTRGLRNRPVVPDLVQGIHLDASDLGKIGQSAAAGLDRAAASAHDLEDAQTAASSSSKELRSETDKGTRSTSLAARAADHLAGSVASVADATRQAATATAGAGHDTDVLRAAELRMAVAQKQVEVAQGRFNKLRAAGKAGSLEYQRAELGVIDALRRVAREQELASREQQRLAAETERARLAEERMRRGTGLLGVSLVGFAHRAKDAGAASKIMGIAVGSLKIPAVVTALTLASSAVSSLGAGAIALTFQLVGGASSLAGALAALPALLGALVSAKGTFSALTKGPAEAAKAIRQYGAASEQAKKALAALDPQARGFARTLADEAGRLETIRRLGQKAALPGFTKALEQSRKLLPEVAAGFVGISKSLGAVAKEAAGAFTTPAFRSDVALIAKRNAVEVRQLGRVAISLVSALRGVVVAAGPMVTVFTKAAVALAKTTDAFVNSAAGQAKLAAFFARTTTNVFRLVGFVKDLGAGLVNLGRIGSQALGIDFTGGLATAAKDFRAFTESAKGKNSIAKFFADARPVLVETGALLRDLAKGFVSLGASSELATVIRQIRTELLPAVLDLAKGVSTRLGPTLVNIATAFVKFIGVLSFSPIITVAGAIAKLAIGIADLATTVPKLGTIIASLIALRVAVVALAGIGKFTGLTSLVSAVTAIGPAGTAGGKGLVGFVQGLRGAQAEAGKTASAMNNIGGAIRNFVANNGGLVGSLRAVRGALITTAAEFTVYAIAAAAILAPFYLLYRAHQNAKAVLDDFTDSVKADSGAIGENTRALAANRLEKSGAFNAAQKLGIDLSTLTDAYLGNKDAVAAVHAVTDKYGGALRHVSGIALLDSLRGLDKNTAAAVRLREALAEGNKDVPEAIARYQRLKAAGVETADANADLANSLGRVGGAAKDAGVKAAVTRRQFIVAAEAAGLAAGQAKHLATNLGLIPKKKTIVFETIGAEEAIALIAELRAQAEGVPKSVTVGVLNKLGATGGAGTGATAPTGVAVTAGAAAKAAKSQADKIRAQVEKQYGDIGTTAGTKLGTTAATAAAKAFVNQFVKHGTDLTKAGSGLVKNLVAGLTGSQTRIQQTADNLKTLIRGAFSGAEEDRLIAKVKATNSKLISLAKQRDDLIARIKQARQDVIDQSVQAGEGLRTSIVGSGDVTQQGNDQGVTNVLRIIGNLRQKVELAKRFVANLALLKKRGIDADTLRQLIEAGPVEGGQAADALAKATDKQLAEVVNLQGQLETVGTKAQTFATTTLEDLGAKAIDGLVKGLRDNEHKVEAEMLRIARTMRDSIRHALGIASPSKVMGDDVGDPAVDGIVVRLDAGRRRVAAAGQRLADASVGTPRVGAVGPLPQAGATTANGQNIGTVIHIGRIEMTSHNPVPEPFAETTAPANLRKVAAVLSR